MKNITQPLLLPIAIMLSLFYKANAQEPQTGQTLNIPIANEQVTQPKNTFVDYHDYILNNERFRFRKEIKKVKKESDFLEYASADNNIRISKYDYMKLMRRAVNQSESKTEFMNHIAQYFVDEDKQFAQQVDFEAVYDATRQYTFYGYFDGLPRIH